MSVPYNLMKRLDNDSLNPVRDQKEVQNDMNELKSDFLEATLEDAKKKEGNNESEISSDDENSWGK